MDGGISERGRNAEPLIEAVRRRHRALAILRTLDRLPGYACNDRVLADYLDRLGLGGSREAVRAGLYELKQLDAVRLEEVEGVLVVTLSERGAELAAGRRITDEVARPGPECPY